MRQPKFVWLQSPPWDGVWTRQNHFSRRFAADGAEVLYVENPSAFAERLKETDSRAGLLSASVRRDVEPGIHVMSLPLQLPGSRGSGLVGRVNGAIFANAIARWLRREGWSDPVYWCRQPISVEALGRLGGSRVVYDVTDDYATFAANDAQRALTIARENRLIARSRQVFTTTDALADSIRGRNPNVQVVRNGVDPRFFAPAPADETDPFPDIPRPRIGHIGLVASWVDLEVMAKIAARWPGQFISIGPVKPEVRAAYESIPGLVRLPPVHNLDLPKYLRAFDVCILPHLPIETCHGADPLKIVEYMALGKPIVSTALRSVTELGDLVDTADDHEAFLAAIERHLAQPANQARSAAQIERARQRSWDNQYRTVRERVLAGVIGQD